MLYTLLKPIREFIRTVGKAAQFHTLTPRKGKLELPGFTGKVKIYRDQFFVPYIIAENEPDLYRAQGYLHAHDRLWQMEITRRLLTGRISEVFGEVSLGREVPLSFLADKTTVNLDLFMRTFQLDQAAKLSMSVVSESLQDVLNAYVEGVNIFIQKGRKYYPPELKLLQMEVEPWKAQDILLFSKGICFELSFSWRAQLIIPELIQTAEEKGLPPEALMPHIEDMETLILEVKRRRGALAKDPLRWGEAIDSFFGFSYPGQGSNNWVVDGTLTTTGKPILANDPHMLLRAPGVWYENYLEVPDLKLSGGTFPGTPGIQLGRNERIGWGITNLMLDDTDIYREKRNPANPNQYQVNDEWVDFETIDECIRIKNKPPVFKKVRRSRHGVILDEVVGYRKTDEALSLKWIADGATRESDAFFGMNHAGNWDEFCEAIAMITAPGGNVVYADVDGNIGYHAVGSIPIRRNPDRLGPYEGWNDESEWLGYVPFEALPHVLNPESHYIVSSNNKTTSDKYPYYITYYWEPEYRAKRIHTLLNQKFPLSTHDCGLIQNDAKSLFAEQFINELIVPVFSKTDWHDPLARQAAKIMMQWDGDSQPDSLGSAIFHVYHYHLLRKLLIPILGESLTIRYFELLHSAFLPTLEILKDEKSAFFKDRDRDEIMLEAFSETINWFVARFTTDLSRWIWGSCHKLSMRHYLESQPVMKWLFNIGHCGAAGDGFTVNLSSNLYSLGFEVLVGPAYRFILDFSEQSTGRSVLPTGQSGNLLSKHYEDQFPMWYRGEYHAFPWTPKGVSEEEMLIIRGTK